MIEWFQSGGFFMWPILVAAILVVFVAARSAFATRDRDAPELQRGRTDAVLFWGGFAALAGVFGTLGGIAQLARVVQRAGGVPSSMLWGGIEVSLVTSLFGLGVLLLALVLWYVLRTRAPSV